MKKIIVVGLLLVSQWVLAAAQTGIQPAMVGFEASGTAAYIGLSTNPNGCLYGAVYFTAGPVDAKAAVSIALAAKLAGKTIRVDYGGGNGAQCIGYGIYIE